MALAATNDSKEVLRGTTLEVYRFLLKSNKPVGTRELQRALDLSSPSVATYHLSKLEDAGLLKREGGGFTVSKFLLENSVKVNRFLIPRFLFYTIFAVAALVFELTLMRPAQLTREYVFSLLTTSVLAIFCTYETVKTWLRGNL
ncbi:MAG: winged helix-turn-helix domain-containing protein [Candidatus Bathyarchaeia archaeon]|jgi:DNA-binding transcriptional ArsR family regulator